MEVNLNLCAYRLNSTKESAIEAFFCTELARLLETTIEAFGDHPGVREEVFSSALTLVAGMAITWGINFESLCALTGHAFQKMMNLKDEQSQGKAPTQS